MTKEQVEAFFSGLNLIACTCPPDRICATSIKSCIILSSDPVTGALSLVPLRGIEKDEQCWKAICDLFDRVVKMNA